MARRENPEAVRLYADALEEQDSSWRKTADAIRSGYRNIWIKAGIRAVEDALRYGSES